MDKDKWKICGEALNDDNTKIITFIDINEFDEIPYYATAQAYFDTDTKQWKSLAIDGVCEIYSNVIAWADEPSPYIPDENISTLVENAMDKLREENKKLKK